MSGGVMYTLFECRGCNAVFHETSSWNDDDVDQWYGPSGETKSEANYTKETFPKAPGRARPAWFEVTGAINSTLYDLLDETYKADEAGCTMLAAVGLRAALDNCFEAVGIEAGAPFEQKLKALLTKGYIGETEHGLLDVLIDAGNAAVHRGWSPERQNVHLLMDVLENFIGRVFVNGERALAMREAIPQRQPRTKRAPAEAAGLTLVAADEPIQTPSPPPETRVPSVGINP